MPVAPFPRSLGRFTVTAELGRGRYGTVFLAADPDTGEDRAVKRIVGAVADDPVMRARCLREAEISARLDHPGIVKVFGVEEFEHGLLLVMERCGGVDLQRALEARGSAVVPADWAVEVVRQLAEAVAHGHARGVVHRDLKPANVMIDPPPAEPAWDDDLRIASGAAGEDTRDPPATPAVVARVLDFGLALPLDEEFRLTRSSMMVGTPLYMAPEQANGNTDAIGPPTDVFGLGSILYELLTGEPPFYAPHVTGVLDRLAEGRVTPPRLSRDDVPRDLETVCLKCLRTEPEDRYADAAALADDLGRVGRSEPIAATPESHRTAWARWAARPGRVERAGAAAATLHALVLVWATAATLLLAAGAFGRDRLPARLDASLLPLYGLLLPCNAFSLWTGWRTARGRGDARRAGLACLADLFLLGHCVFAACGLIAPPLMVSADDPFSRAMAFMFLAAVYGLMVTALAVAAVGLARRG